MTLREALAAGYRVHSRKYTGGYISRRITKEEILDKPLQYAPRKQMFFYEEPAFETSNYHYRIYLIKE